MIALPEDKCSSYVQTNKNNRPILGIKYDEAVSKSLKQNGYSNSWTCKLCKLFYKF